jgi:hypothetical protein
MLPQPRVCRDLDLRLQPVLLILRGRLQLSHGQPGVSKSNSRASARLLPFSSTSISLPRWPPAGIDLCQTR